MVGFRNLEQIKQLKPGGVVLFGWSMTSVDETRRVTDLLKVAAAAHLKSPLFVATDHEGGKVLRLRQGLTPFPDALALGSIGDSDLAFRVGRSMGYELSALGFNMNLAPVVDLGNARTFLENRVWGIDPTTVGQMTLQFSRGLKASGVVPVAKHFPGHGGTNQDSHFTMPQVFKSRQRLFAEDLVPFKSILGTGGVDVVMTAHVEFPEIARGPASLSREFLTDILREQLNFKGLVLTDDFEMGGIGPRLGAAPEDLALRALVAGTDMVLVVWSLEMQHKIMRRLERALKSGEISQAWLDEKVAHIATVKKKLLGTGLDQENPFWKQALKSAEHVELVKEILERAIQWDAGRSGQLIADFRARLGESWHVVLPSQAMAKAWRLSRPKDTLVVVGKRIDEQRKVELVRGIEKSMKASRPCVVVTGPRASYSEDFFKGLKESLLKWEQKKVIRGPFVWAHQGSTPVDLRKDPKQLSFGIVSLHSSGARSVALLGEQLSRAPRQAGDLVKE